MNAYRHALRRGKLQRGPCAVCGKTELYSLPTDGHHEDYAEPLNVIWLCRLHHSGRHQGQTVAEMIADIEGRAPATIEDAA